MQAVKQQKKKPVLSHKIILPIFGINELLIITVCRFSRQKNDDHYKRTNYHGIDSHNREKLL